MVASADTFRMKDIWDCLTKFLPNLHKVIILCIKEESEIWKAGELGIKTMTIATRISVTTSWARPYKDEWHEMRRGQPLTKMQMTK